MIDTIDLSKAVMYDLEAYRETKIDETFIPVSVFDSYETGENEYYTLDLTVYAYAKLQVRQSKQSKLVLLEASTDNGYLNLLADKIEMKVPADKLNFNQGDYYYDLRLYNDDTDARVLMYGKFKLKQNITI